MYTSAIVGHIKNTEYVHTTVGEPGYVVRFQLWIKETYSLNKNNPPSLNLLHKQNPLIKLTPKTKQNHLIKLTP